jgi:hypothetical protein
MAAPFGNHPTLNDYLMWAYGQGCRAKSVLGRGDDGKMCTFQLIEAPSGRYVFTPDLKASEHMVPTLVAYLDRRLGLDSPFSKVQFDD